MATSEDTKPNELQRERESLFVCQSVMLTPYNDSVTLKYMFVKEKYTIVL